MIYIYSDLHIRPLAGRPLLCMTPSALTDAIKTKLLHSKSNMALMVMCLVLTQKRFVIFVFIIRAHKEYN